MSKRLRRRKERMRRRLDKDRFPKHDGPVLDASNIQYELADRTLATNYGGIGLVHNLVRELGLAKEIDDRLHVLKLHLPYHESDHVLNLAYNVLCDGQRLEDLEGRRQDEAYLNALDAERVPDPTTAGDFCRRFGEADLQDLEEAIDAARLKVWARQEAKFFQVATIDVDGSLVGTDGECKQGMGLSYSGIWGYHPLLVTLANTGEELRLANRPGNRPSHEDAAKYLDQAIALCTRAGFARIVLRGDTDFTQTTHLDRWNDLGNVQFIFGMDVTPARHIEADELPETAWKTLHRPPSYEVQTKRRGRRVRVKQQVVDTNLYKDIRLVYEEVAEMEYRPAACKRAYRLVILRKELEVRARDQLQYLPDYRYFFWFIGKVRTKGLKNVDMGFSWGFDFGASPLENTTCPRAYFTMRLGCAATSTFASRSAKMGSSLRSNKTVPSCVARRAARRRCNPRAGFRASSRRCRLEANRSRWLSRCRVSSAESAAVGARSSSGLPIRAFRTRGRLRVMPWSCRGT
jgi:hypothetical protein